MTVILLLLTTGSVLLMFREITGLRRDRRNDAVAASQAAEAKAAWRARFEAENPDETPLTEAEIEEFRAWHASLALPAVELVPAPGRRVTAGGTRIGGPVWLRDGEAWPIDAEGAPLEFVAQVDFTELPPLPDFPTAGLLQFFVGSSDASGAEFDEPARGSARVLWRPDALEGGRLHPPPPVGDTSPFQRQRARNFGAPLAGEPATQLPGGSHWEVHHRLEGQLRRPGLEELEEVILNPAM